MIFNTFQFLWVCPLLFGAYYMILSLKNRPKHTHRLENLFLIVVSYLLYMQWKPIYALVLLGITAITYFTAIHIEKTGIQKRKKCLLAAGVILSILPLLAFKYLNFLNEIITSFLHLAGIELQLPGLNWVLPLGISFYTLQAIGYLYDVYKERIEAERNWWDYMLFVCFFPQIVAGPINKAAQLLPQIKAQRSFAYDRVAEGCRWLLWGMFLKVVMADRVGLQANTILNSYEYLNGFTCLKGILLYTFQIYGDFAGYSFMALGVGKIFGFELTNNFNRPYFSESITEFWHRWHISLSTWLKDYIYIPLGGSRCSKTRNYWNIIVTFLVSGIWHGANWTFIVWGLIHGGLQVVEKALGVQGKSNRGMVKVARILCVFVAINIAWIFFRMPSIEDALMIVRKIVVWSPGTTVYISPAKLLLVYLGIGITVMNDVIDEIHSKNLTLLSNRHGSIRWISYILLLVLILSCGVFDTSQFIYAKF